MGNGALDRFDAAMAAAATPEPRYAALHALADEIVGARLFTVMITDMQAMLARRAYSSDAENYPVSGIKPIVLNRWFNHVAHRREVFVANTLDDIDDVFPDAALIGRLGCGSVLNLPVFDNGALAGTANLLHEAGHYTPARVALAKEVLTGPAHTAILGP